MGSHNPVILSERSESKNLPKLRVPMENLAHLQPGGELRLRSLAGCFAPNVKDPCHPERSDLRDREVELFLLARRATLAASPEGWKTAPVGSSHRPSGDPSTPSRTRSLRMTGFSAAPVIPSVGVTRRRGGAQGDRVCVVEPFEARPAQDRPSGRSGFPGRPHRDSLVCVIQPEHCERRATCWR